MNEGKEDEFVFDVFGEVVIEVDGFVFDVVDKVVVAVDDADSAILWVFNALIP